MYHAHAGHPSVPEITDEELMQRISDRDQAAFDRLFTRYRLLLHKIVSGILPNLADADEALQDVFLEIWKRAQNFDVRKGKPLGWIICLARRRTIDHYHKLRRRADIDLQLNGENGDGRNVAGDEFIDLPVADDQATGRDLRQFLTALIRDLPAEQGDAIYLSYFEGMSQSQIASHTGTPLGTIKTRLNLGLRKLARMSTEYRKELSL